MVDIYGFFCRIRSARSLTMSTIAKPMNVFVYGTLKTHQPNHYWLQKNKGHATFICNGVTVDTFPLLVATKFNIPFMLNRPGVGKNVHGEIYEIDETMLTNLDDLEDYPQLYNRIIANVIGSDRYYIINIYFHIHNLIVLMTVHVYCLSIVAHKSNHFLLLLV